MTGLERSWLWSHDVLGINVDADLPRRHHSQMKTLETKWKVPGTEPTWEINISRRWSNLLSPVSTQEVRVWLGFGHLPCRIILLLWTKEAYSSHSVYYFTHIISSPGANSRYSKTAPCRSRTGETRWISPICQHWREYSKLGVADTARPSDAKCIMSQFTVLPESECQYID